MHPAIDLDILTKKLCLERNTESFVKRKYLCDFGIFLVAL